MYAYSFFCHNLKKKVRQNKIVVIYVNSYYLFNVKKIASIDSFREN